MSDDKLTDSKSQDNKDKKDGSAKNTDGRNTIMQFVQAKFVEYRAEFRKIIWLSRKELTKRTVTVVVTSLLFGLVIFGIDTVFALSTQYFFTLVGK